VLLNDSAIFEYTQLKKNYNFLLIFEMLGMAHLYLELLQVIVIAKGLHQKQIYSFFGCLQVNK